ncbi:MAG: peptidoglycan-binding domain-containing protein [Blastocatellia bacterium]
MNIQTFKSNTFGFVGLLATTLCLLLVSASAQQATAKKLPPGARINKNEVIIVQVELRRLGYLKSGITGQLDAETSEAVKAYQRKNGLPVSGGIDTATYEKLGLEYPAPIPNDPNIAVRTGGAIKEGGRVTLEKGWDGGAYVASKSKEGGRYALEKGWDGGAYVASKSKDAAKASWSGTKNATRAGGRKTVSMIRRKDGDIDRELSELFFERNDWTGVQHSTKDGMVTLKLPPKSKVDVGNLVSEIRKVAGVRSVFVIAL